MVGFADACGRSRLAQPAAHAWAAGTPLRLHEVTRPAGGTGPKALACYGLLRADTGELLLRFVSGRPVSRVTEDFLAWACERLAAAGQRVLALAWGNAAWHVSKRVRAWLRAHDRRVKGAGDGVRILACRLPIEAPWLNPIEPKWAPGQRAIIEPERALAAHGIRERACTCYGCEQRPLLQQQVA